MHNQDLNAHVSTNAQKRCEITPTWGRISLCYIDEQMQNIDIGMLNMKKVFARQ